MCLIPFLSPDCRDHVCSVSVSWDWCLPWWLADGGRARDFPKNAAEAMRGHRWVLGRDEQPAAALSQPVLPANLPGRGSAWIVPTELPTSAPPMRPHRLPRTPGRHEPCTGGSPRRGEIRCHVLTGVSTKCQNLAEPSRQHSPWGKRASGKSRWHLSS